MLLYAVISISLALVFYSIGVWSEKIQGKLKNWHLYVFWIGFAFDTIGTTLMGRISGSGFVLNFHGITGVTAIVLMLIHAVWATVVVMKNNTKARENFHKISIFVWILWLIPFFSGMIAGMTK